MFHTHVGAVRDNQSVKLPVFHDVWLSRTDVGAVRDNQSVKLPVFHDVWLFCLLVEDLNSELAPRFGTNQSKVGCFPLHFGVGWGGGGSGVGAVGCSGEG